jgi:tRNA pseudouridine(38-40) synthase
VVKLSRFALCLGYLPILHYSGFSGDIHDSTNIFTFVQAALKNARLPYSTQFASRTDKGVGAIHQVIVLDSIRPPILSEINSYLPKEIQILGVAHVPPTFDPRRDTTQRTYSYFLTTSNHSTFPRLQTILQGLQGHHNFRNFAKNDPKRPHLNYLRAIDCIEINSVASSVYQIRLSAKSFLWQQVRRIVGFLLEVLSGQRNETDLAILLD